MFYKIIEQKRDEWLDTSGCIAARIISYIERRGALRDAQTEAIKTFLYLKIGCHNRPLWQLLADGTFNTLTPADIDALEVSAETRRILSSQAAALALWQYATAKDEQGNINAPALRDAIRHTPESIDYVNVIKNLFYNVSYPDYLFSIPMGAGKTYLMAAFIYLNLYFAYLEPDNDIFAHNFIIFVPSGHKSSVIPSLKDIQNFDPHWILPDPVAGQLKKIIHYEWLQDDASSSRNNLVRNPNARKIASYLAVNKMGLVAVTNAEKVILDRPNNNDDFNRTIYASLSEKEKTKYLRDTETNELRHKIGDIPGLCILIDEVHHASESQKLRLVVNRWMTRQSFNSVLGFSGTPNMGTPIKVQITDTLSIRCTRLANVVTYYPLIRGIGNFLKIPTVHYADASSDNIITAGLKEFFDRYRNTVYADGTVAKIAVYAPSIAYLEEELAPAATDICNSINLDPAVSILKYHNGNKLYRKPDDADYRFNSLDSPLSKVRIVLLVGIGREGWNCKSLTGVILSQRNACSNNLVLQVCCRCLRQVDNRRETALIWLNKYNADILDSQLHSQQFTTLSTFSSIQPERNITIRRYPRDKTLNLPDIDYYQLYIRYDASNESVTKNIDSYIRSYNPVTLDRVIIHSLDITGKDCTATDTLDTEDNSQYITYIQWIDTIIKESFGTMSLDDILPYHDALRSLYDRLVIKDGDTERLNPRYDQKAARSYVRCGFGSRRSLRIIKDMVHESNVALLRPDILPDTVGASDRDIYVPDQDEADRIIRHDRNPSARMTDEKRRMLADMVAQGLLKEMPAIDDDADSITSQTYHYLPYHMDSRLERNYFEDALAVLRDIPGIELYYNGDRSLTDFKIRCYSRHGETWQFLGNYTPDFVLLRRGDDNSIDKVVIIETKGSGYIDKFRPYERFMREYFLPLNEQQYGRRRFEFMLIPESDNKDKRINDTIRYIESFLLS